MTRATFTEKAERLRKLLVAAREESGLTQVQVAGRLRKPQSYVSKIERGERRLDIIEFFELAEILKIDPFEFLQTLQRKH